MKSQMKSPQLRTGAHMFPDKPAPAKKCLFCRRKSTEYVIDKDHALCTNHRSPRDLKRVEKYRKAKERQEALARRPVRRRPWGRKIHPSVM